MLQDNRFKQQDFLYLYFFILLILSEFRYCLYSQRVVGRCVFIMLFGGTWRHLEVFCKKV
ncbi:hypothetical protein BMS3Bbin06_00168 [bacterium BMS3Bbin06]|nr:hypothetical protein BMS3Bbin06_00168 [bacterium BMS3Bbin06]